MPSDRLRGALIGAGNIAPYHLLAWQDIAGVEIVALCDRDRVRASELANRFGIDNVYSDLSSLLEREQLDFIDIATPPQTHAELVTAAAESRVHVLCQKPFATSLDEAERMIAACDAAGVRCVVNENWRWRRWYRELKRMIDAEEVGEPRYIRFTWHGDDALPEPDGSHPRLVTRQPYAAALPRLILFEWGIHLVDVMRFLMGNITRVYAQISRRSPVIAGEDLAVVNLAFENGAIGAIDVSWSSCIADDRRFVRGMVDPLVVEGTKGTIELDPFDDDALFVTGIDRARRRHDARGELSRPEAYQECFTKAHRHFAERLRDGLPAENEAPDNWNTLATVFAAYESADTGSPIEVLSRER